LPTQQKLCENMSEQFTYTYVDISGRGLPARHLLAHAKSNAIQKNMIWGTSHLDPNVDMTNHVMKVWFPMKEKLQEKNPFLFMPFIETENGEIISSTLGILCYLGKRYGYLTGYDEKFDYKIQNALDHAQELREGFFKAIMFGESVIALYADKDGFLGPWKNLKTFELQLTQQNKKNNTEKTYLFDQNKLSTADFYVFSTISIMKKWHKSLLKDLPELQKWYDFMLENEDLARQVEQEKDQPIFGHQDGFKAMAEIRTMPGLKNIVWGVPGKLEPMFD